MDAILVPLHSRRLPRALILQKVNHAIPAVGLVATGAQALKEGAGGFDLALGLVEIGTSVLLISTIVRSFRATWQHTPSGPRHSHKVDWIDIWASAVLFAEAAERWHLKHHIARPVILTALVTLALGLFHDRIAALGRRRRALKVTTNGIYIGGPPFRRFSARWDDVRSISVAGSLAEIRTRGGRVRRLDLAGLENADAVRAALEEARRRLAALSATEPAPAAGLPPPR